MIGNFFFGGFLGGGGGEELLVFVILGELGEEPGQYGAVGVLLNGGDSLLVVELLDKLLAGGLHGQEALHVGIGQILVGALAGVLLDGLGHHLGAGEVLAVGSPLSVFGSAEDTGLFFKSLGDLGVGIVDVDDSVLFHGGNLLFHFIFCFEGLCFFLVLCPSLCLNYSRDEKEGLAHKQTM